MNNEKLQDGVFVQLKMGRWDARTHIPTSKLDKKIPQEIIRVKQDTIEDRSLLQDLTTIRRAAKGLLKRNSFPFPIDGLFWVPKDKIPFLDEQFTKFEEQYKDRIANLCNNMKRMEKEFKSKYPDFYDPKNYPPQHILKKKFYFHWNFLHFTTPSRKAKILSPKLYKKEKDKFDKMISQMEEMTVSLIGNSILTRIDKLSSQCESGKINNGTVNSISKLLKRWNDLWEDHVDEAKLKSVMSMLKKQMKTVSTERLKSNEDFRNKLGEKLNKISAKIKVIPDFKLKRKLDI